LPAWASRSIAASNRSASNTSNHARNRARGKLFNGFLDVFGSGHPENISVTHKP
jgi:hypothetical protein